MKATRSANRTRTPNGNGQSTLGRDDRDRTTGRRKSEMRYQRGFETAHDGIVILDASTGLILEANAYVSNLLALSHDELVGSELWQVGLLLDSERSRATAALLREPGFIRHEEIHLRTASYPEGVDLEVISNTYQEDGDQVIQCHIRDISKRKRAELGAAVHAEEMALAARNKNEFLAMLSHELRNALAPLVNALHVLRLGKDTESVATNRTRALMERQVGHMSHLVDDLQEISCIESGRMRLEPGMVDLRVVVQRSVEAVMMAHAHRQHLVSVALPEEPVWLDADAIRLEQVVVNLVSNAANYTSDGGRIAVNVGHSRDRAELRVADSGTGIDPEVLPRVFDLFTRGESAGNHSRNGQGIGLNIVKRIVDLHGGTVEARSAGPGAGSEFVVSLPLVFPFTL